MKKEKENEIIEPGVSLKDLIIRAGGAGYDIWDLDKVMVYTSQEPDEYYEYHDCIKLVYQKGRYPFEKE